MVPTARTIAVLLAACTVCECQQNTEFRSRIDSIFAPLADRKSPGLAVLVRKDGRTLFQRGYGVRDLRTLAPITAGTDFRLASVTKQFTAMAVMLLVHDGKLRYDTRLTDVLPGFPSYGREIAIRHLLTHTSGVPDYESLMESVEKPKGPIWTSTHQIQDSEVLGLFKGTEPKFAPGTGWAYSNSGYVLLGLVVAKAAGEPFERFLHDRIFRPLRMTRTLVYVNGKNTIPNRAFGYTRSGDTVTETDQSPTSATLGDGGVYSNVADLAKWDAALENHSLLAEEEMRVALTPVTLNNESDPKWPLAPASDDNLNPGKPVSYGFGWFLDPYKGRPRMWHSGGTLGFRTAIHRFTEQKLTVVVLCNRTDLDPTALALRTADILLK